VTVAVCHPRLRRRYLLFEDGGRRIQAVQRDSNQPRKKPCLLRRVVLPMREDPRPKRNGPGPQSTKTDINEVHDHG